MFGFGKNKTPTRNTSANRAAVSKTGKTKTATRTKAKCTVCRQRRQVDTANKICGRHQCAKALTRRLEPTKPRAKKTTTKKPATRKTTPKPATSKPATPATSSRKKTHRATPKPIAGTNSAVDNLWSYRCQVLEVTDELLTSGELNPADTKTTKQIANKARAYTFQQFATAYRTDRARYEAMAEDVVTLLSRAQGALKSVRATQAAQR